MRKTSLPMPPRPITPSVLPKSWTPSCGTQVPPRTSRSTRDFTAGCKHQRNGMFGNGGVAVVPHGVNLDPAFRHIGKAHVARGPAPRNTRC